MTNDATKNLSPQTQRIDKWLWYARFFKTRSLASKFVSAGHIRLSRKDNDSDTQRVDKPRTTVQPGNILTFMYGNRVRIIHVLECGKRRGPASEAQTLYQDCSPPPPPKEEKQTNGIPLRDSGAGRPTKKDRRAMEALKENY